MAPFGTNPTLCLNPWRPRRFDGECGPDGLEQSVHPFLRALT